VPDAAAADELRKCEDFRFVGWRRADALLADCCTGEVSLMALGSLPSDVAAAPATFDARTSAVGWVRGENTIAAAFRLEGVDAARVLCTGVGTAAAAAGGTARRCEVEPILDGPTISCGVACETRGVEEQHGGHSVRVTGVDKLKARC